MCVKPQGQKSYKNGLINNSGIIIPARGKKLFCDMKRVVPPPRACKYKYKLHQNIFRDLGVRSNTARLQDCRETLASIFRGWTSHAASHCRGCQFPQDRNTAILPGNFCQHLPGGGPSLQHRIAGGCQLPEYRNTAILQGNSCRHLPGIRPPPARVVAGHGSRE